ncbi:MAG TPA: glycosyltransferase family 2 protein [Acidobacteriaceae bacterium]|jgi:glycosyltransferase involved in cell wall biosynthesis|nr:glycosyltransferase family 2 protein [Acidobacteriaceae bacterium]
MRVSIALCTYNGEKYLQEQLESIASQSLLPWELVVCDDGSSDATIDILYKFCETAPFTVRIFLNEANLGSTKNFEQAIHLCSGDLIALCDQDDIWISKKLEEAVCEFQTRSDLDALFTDAEIIDEASKPVHFRLWQSIEFTRKLQARFKAGESVPVLLKRNVVTGATLIFRSSCRDSVLPIPQSWVHDGWIAWMVALKNRIDFIPKPLIYYRIHLTQQIGPPPLTVLGKFKSDRASTDRTYCKEALQYKDLRTYVNHKANMKDPLLLKHFDRKIYHSNFRSKLKLNKFLRIFSVIPRIRYYNLYSNGWKSIFKDLLR